MANRIYCLFLVWGCIHTVSAWADSVAGLCTVISQQDFEAEPPPASLRASRGEGVAQLIREPFTGEQAVRYRQPGEGQCSFTLAESPFAAGQQFVLVSLMQRTAGFNPGHGWPDGGVNGVFRLSVLDAQGREQEHVRLSLPYQAVPAWVPTTLGVLVPVGGKKMRLTLQLNSGERGYVADVFVDNLVVRTFALADIEQQLAGRKPDYAYKVMHHSLSKVRKLPVPHIQVKNDPQGHYFPRVMAVSGPVAGGTVARELFREFNNGLMFARLRLRQGAGETGAGAVQWTLFDRSVYDGHHVTAGAFNIRVPVDDMSADKFKGHGFVFVNMNKRAASDHRDQDCIELKLQQHQGLPFDVDTIEVFTLQAFTDAPAKSPFWNPLSR